MKLYSSLDFRLQNGQQTNFPSVSLFRFTIIVPINKKINQKMILPLHCLELSLRKHAAIFPTHDIFRLDAWAVKRIRGCVAGFILGVVYILLFSLSAWLSWDFTSNLTKIIGREIKITFRSCFEKVVRSCSVPFSLLFRYSIGPLRLK